VTSERQRGALLGHPVLLVACVLYFDLVEAGRIDLTGMLTHTFALDDWRAAFTVLATQASSDAIKVAFDQRT
jgi:threonine dehydrogenase-like Zn-dependent dehydrogenase